MLRGEGGGREGDEDGLEKKTIYLSKVVLYFHNKPILALLDLTDEIPLVLAERLELNIINHI